MRRTRQERPGQLAEGDPAGGVDAREEQIRGDLADDLQK